MDGSVDYDDENKGMGENEDTNEDHEGHEDGEEWQPPRHAPPAEATRAAECVGATAQVEQVEQFLGRGPAAQRVPRVQQRYQEL